MSDEEADDDFPQLSAATLLALQSFQTERSAQDERLSQLRARAETQDKESHPYEPLTMLDFAEDWNASQFWYNIATATIFAKALLAGATNHTNIAIVSAPSVFIQLKNLLATTAYAGVQPRLHLLEFDDRFDIFKENFVHYDSHHPLRLPLELKGSLDRVICDPPFLSKDCQTEMSTTIRWLLRPEVLEAPAVAPSGTNISGSGPGSSPPLVIICTGRVMESLVLSLYSGMRATTFEVMHERGRLHNEWGCYANFECEDWKFVV